MGAGDQRQTRRPGSSCRWPDRLGSQACETPAGSAPLLAELPRSGPLGSGRGPALTLRDPATAASDTVRATPEAVLPAGEVMSIVTLALETPRVVWTTTGWEGPGLSGATTVISVSLTVEKLACGSAWPPISTPVTSEG